MIKTQTKKAKYECELKRIKVTKPERIFAILREKSDEYKTR